MDERGPSPETQVPSREQVVQALRAIAERGYTNPDDLPAADPNVKAANAMFYTWFESAAHQASLSPDPAAVLEHQQSTSMVYVDAGFSDPAYLDEVANDWLVQDLDNAQAQGLNVLATRIQGDIDAINTRLAHK